jgi:hypothetical protein
VTQKGQVIFGIGCGLLTYFIRYIAGIRKGILFHFAYEPQVWLIAKYTSPKKFGEVQVIMKQENNPCCAPRFFVCLYTDYALLLASVNALTADVIKQNEVNKLIRLPKVFPDAVQFPEAAVADADKADRGMSAPIWLPMRAAKFWDGCLSRSQRVWRTLNMIVGVDADGKVVLAEILSLPRRRALVQRLRNLSLLTSMRTKAAISA